MLLWIGLLVCVAIVGPTALSAQTSAPDWRSDWAVAEGFSLRKDTDGCQFPTAIAVVPDPGRDPGDPLYFVTELQGTIKVVTNDRTVHVFARVPAPVEDTLPEAEAEVGLAGICLEPRRGYVFATCAYGDADRVLRNAIVRFRTAARRFGILPSTTWWCETCSPTTWRRCPTRSAPARPPTMRSYRWLPVSYQLLPGAEA
jgi:hypothetical protein